MRRPQPSGKGGENVPVPDSQTIVLSLPRIAGNGKAKQPHGAWVSYADLISIRFSTRIG